MKMKHFNAKKQDLVSSRESMSTKGIGITVDATTIPVSCKSTNSNQNVQIKQQSTRYADKNKHFKKERSFGGGARKVLRRWEKTMLQKMGAITMVLGSEGERPSGSAKNETCFPNPSQTQ